MAGRAAHSRCADPGSAGAGGRSLTWLRWTAGVGHVPTQ